jgi:outer membrane protein assembly factor BamB
VKRLGATSAPWIVGDELFLSRRAAGAGEQVVLSASDGRVRRTQRKVRADYLADIPVFAPAEHARSLGTVALAGPQIVVATRTGEIYGLDVDTGYTIWSVATGRTIVAQPVVAKGWVYASTADGSVMGLEVADVSLD